MSNNLNHNIVSAAKSSFECICFKLLEDAYICIKNKNIISHDFEEDSISLYLVDEMNQTHAAIKRHITVHTQEPIVPMTTNTRRLSVKQVPRIDICFGGFGINERHTFYMEAKNLYETNVKKTGKKNKISAKQYIKRYIDTGIQHIVSNRYPRNSALIGYVLNGSPSSIINMINQEITSLTSHRESISILQNTQYPQLIIGESCHNQIIHIKHCFLDFS